MFADYLSGNVYLAHPAMAGDRVSGVKISSVLRQQWIEQNDAPNLQSFTIEYNASAKSKLALHVFSDKNGYHHRNGFYATYAHHISFQDVVWNTKRTFPSKSDKLKALYFGLSVGNLQNAFNGTDYDFTSDDPTLSLAQGTNSYLNADASIAFTTTHWQFNLTVKNLLSSTIQLYNDPNRATRFRRYLLGIKYMHYTPSDWALSPSVLYQTFELSKEQIVDFNFKLYRYFRRGRIWGGISHRRDFVGAGSSIENINLKSPLKWTTPILGIDYLNLQFSYNYITLSGNTVFSNNGIHQLALGFQF